MLFFIRFTSILFAAILSTAVNAGVINRNLPAISYVQFQSFDPGDSNKPLTVSGQLRMPVINAEDEAEPALVPAVLVVHGSSGVDSRGAFYIEALNQAGIATLEIDMWAARTLAGGLNRPPLPTLTLPDAFEALKYLSAVPGIDPERIGILGFSWGGVMAMLAATDTYTGYYGNGLSFAAYVAHYPVCWAYNIGIPGMLFDALEGDPLLVQVGELDDYDEGAEPCQNLIASLSEEDQSIASVNVYSNAYHAWDRLQPAITVVDPFSHLGAGGDVDIVPNPGKAFQSRKRVVRFFQDTFGMAYKSRRRGR